MLLGARTLGLSMPSSQEKQVLVKESGCLTTASSYEFIYGEMEKMGPANSDLWVGEASRVIFCPRHKALSEERLNVGEKVMFTLLP